MAKLLGILILFSYFSIATASDSELIGVWEIEVVPEGNEQFPSWMQIKYPVKLEVFASNNTLLYRFTDQYEYECIGAPMHANQNQELVFEFCGTLGTKNSSTWSPIHHAKVVNGELHGVVTSNRYLFKWVGKRKK